MGMHFSQKKGREFFVKAAGGVEILQKFENHFSKKWPFSKKEENTLKRFFVREPLGRDLLMRRLEKNPGISLRVQSFNLMPQNDIDGMTLFASADYILKEVSNKELILIEQNTSYMDLMKYVF